MKKFIVVLGVIFVVGLAIVFGIIMTTDINEYKGQIVQIVEKTTGRKFEIKGELKLRPSLSPLVRIEGVSLSNADWSKEKNMLNIGSFEAQLALIPLLKKNVQINHIILTDSVIHLEVNEDGMNNWSFKPEGKKEDTKEESGKESTDVALNVNKIRIKNSQIIYMDGDTKEDIHINKLDVRAGILRPVNLEADINYNSMPITLSANLGLISNLMENKSFPINLKASVNEIKITADGKIENPKGMKGIDLLLTVKSNSLLPVAQITKNELPDIGPIEISGRILEVKDGYLLEGFSALVDKITAGGDLKVKYVKKLDGIEGNINVYVPSASDLNSIVGQELSNLEPISLSSNIFVDLEKESYKAESLDIVVGNLNAKGELYFLKGKKRPYLTAKLFSENIDLSPFMQKELKEQKNIKETTKKKDKLFSDEPLSLGWLKLVDLDVTLNAKRLTIPQISFVDLAVKLNLNDGKLNLEQKAQASGGMILSKVNLKSDDGINLYLNNEIDIKNLQVGEIPSIKQKNMLSGAPSDFNLKLTGSGNSVSSIMSRANGNILIKIGKGKISNKTIDNILSFDILSLLKLNKDKSNDNNLKCAVVKFDIKEGVITSEKGIAIESSGFNILGGGVINLKTEELDIGINPSVDKSISLGLDKIAGLIRIGGTLLKPKAKLDTSSTIKAGLSIGAAIATGGVSLLGSEALNNTTKDEDPCNTVLGIATNKPAPEKESIDEKINEGKDKLDKKIDESKDKLEEALKDKFKGLFN